MNIIDKETVKNAILYAGPRLLATIANLIIIPIILASFELSEYGLYALYLSIAIFLTAFTFPRISIESKVGIARGEEEAFLACLFDRIAVAVPVLLLPLLIVSFNKFLDFRINVPLFYAVMYGTILPTILFQSIVNYYLAKEEFLFSSTLELFRALLVGGISAAVAYMTNDIWLFALCKGILDAAYLLFLVLVVSVKRNLLVVFRAKGYHKSIRNYGLKMVVSDSAAAMRTQSTLWVVAAFIGPEGVALFHIAFSSMFQRVSDHALSLINLVYSKVARDSQNSAKGVSLRSVLIVMLIGALLAISAVGLGFVYVWLLLPSAFSQVAWLFWILAVSLPFTLATKFVLLRLVINLEATVLNVLTLSAALIQILLSVGFASQAGLVGACAAIVVGSIVQLVLSVLVVRWRQAYRPRQGNRV